MSFLSQIGLNLAIDSGKLSRSFLVRQARRQLDGFFQGLGPERIKWMVENNCGFAEIISRKNLETLKEKGTRYAALMPFLTDEVALALMPEWVLGIVEKSGESGKTWLLTQAKWLRQVLGIEEKGV